MADSAWKTGIGTPVFRTQTFSFVSALLKAGERILSSNSFSSQYCDYIPDALHFLENSYFLQGRARMLSSFCFESVASSEAIHVGETPRREGGKVVYVSNL